MYIIINSYSEFCLFGSGDLHCTNNRVYLISFAQILYIFESQNQLHPHLSHWKYHFLLLSWDLRASLFGLIRLWDHPAGSYNRGSFDIENISRQLQKIV